MSSCKIESSSKAVPGQNDILSPTALRFLEGLHRTFNHRRKVLLRYREMQHARFSSGELPKFSDRVGSVRHLPWTVASIPDDLEDRRVEISGPVDHKTIVRGFNSTTSIFVADFEDATSPTWTNCIQGQINLKNAVRGDLSYTKKEGGVNRLQGGTIPIEVRPRGLHLDEKHLLVDGEPISASLFDFGLYFFHNALHLKRKGSGPYFSLAKLENRQEAKWWNDVFNYAQNKLRHLPEDTIKTAVCIETLPAVFEVEEIIYELRDYITSLQAGRWNYLFSLIKNFRRYERFILPERDLVSLSEPFMRAYNQLLVKLGHRRGIHVIGGVTVLLPDRSKEWDKVRKKAREDCATEARRGFDGTQVAHPSLVPVALEEFKKVLGDSPHQKYKMKEDVMISRLDLLYTHLLDAGKVTEKAFRRNIDVAILYIASWLKGEGIVELGNRLENAATIEICRTQMWQWSHQPGITLDDGRKITKKLYKQLLEEEKKRITKQGNGGSNFDYQKIEEASQLLDTLVWEDKFESYMTLPAYKMLE